MTRRPATARRTLSTRGLIYLLLALAAALSLVPFVWLILATFRRSDEVFSYLFFAPPSRWTAQNYRDLFALKDFPYLRFLVNSVFIASTSVVVQLFFSSLAGFALAKYDFRGKKPLMALMLATLLIPNQVTLAPAYELLYRMGLVDTYLGLIIPGAVSVFGIFLFRQSILQVPDELIHAARIDGCSEFRIYRDIVMPVTRPMIGAFCLIAFMGSWNSFLWPQVLLHNRARFTLPIGLSQLVGIYNQSYGMLMAGTLIAVLPVIILFFLLQKEFVAGLTAGAVKG
jgi:ABC-type glycerol-3-phosphate transport system permease component